MFRNAKPTGTLFLEADTLSSLMCTIPPTTFKFQVIQHSISNEFVLSTSEEANLQIVQHLKYNAFVLFSMV